MTQTEKLLELQFPARPESLGLMRNQLRQALQGCSRSENTRECVVLAVSEACANIIQHAYCQDAGGDIVMQVELKGCSLVFRLTDFARRKTRPEELRPCTPDQETPGGLGCHIINEIMDEVKIIDCAQSCGNVLQMRKDLEGNDLQGNDPDQRR